MRVIDQEYVEALPLAGLTEHPENPRQGDDESVGESINENGFYGAILVQKSTSQIIAGNTRFRQALAAGSATAPAFLLDVNDDEARRILLADNRTSDLASYNDASLSALLSSIAETERGFYGTGFDELSFSALIDSASEGFDIGDSNDSFEDDYGEFSGVKLADRFLAPPFSVLDGRAGYWRSRKRYWIEEAGITSETGREENLLNASATMMRSSNWKGTSVFDPVLCELMYRWLAPEGGHIIDPFCGGSVRGLVAAACGYTYEGYDLRPEQVEANEANARAIGIPEEEWPQWKVGNSNAGVYDKGDMLLTCPPYWSLERYSDDPEDISSLDSIDAFEEQYADCLAPAVNALAMDSFAVVVIASMRHKGGLFDLGGITIEIMEEQGCDFFNDAILLTPLASAALRGARLFAGRKVVPVHQRVLMFCKGDPVKAIEKLPVTEIMRDEMALASWLDFDGGELPVEAVEAIGDELEDL